MDHDLSRWHARAREKGANPLIYGMVRVSFQLFFWVYFRMQRIGLEHVPRRGPVIVAANHRSFLDPFVIACMARRPMYYVAKEEIFRYPVVNWLLAALGAFPVRRGASDAEMITTAQAILARGDIVLIFPEGTRTRPGALGRPRRGVGRLALQTGAPVVPVAVIGTEAVRRGWRIRPHRVRLRAGRPLRFPVVAEPSRDLAGAVTARIWPCVMLQWEWLGGRPPMRRAAVIGPGHAAPSLAAALTRAGLEVDVQADASGLELAETDLLCLTAPVDLPAGLRLTDRTGVLLGGEAAESDSSRRIPGGARAVAILGASDALLRPGDAVVVGSADRAFRRELVDVMRAAGLQATKTKDLAEARNVQRSRQRRAA